MSGGRCYLPICTWTSDYKYICEVTDTKLQPKDERKVSVLYCHWHEIANISALKLFTERP